MKLKKLFTCFLVAVLSFIAVFTMNACDGGNKPNTSGVDLDLTKLSSTMVYSEVFNMVNTPEDYVGKKIKMSGDFAVYFNQETDEIYPAVIIADATSCCAQGIEFVLANGKYPNDYPNEKEFVTVVGTFETYFEGPYRYCHLVDAVII